VELRRGPLKLRNTKVVTAFARLEHDITAIILVLILALRPQANTTNTTNTKATAVAEDFKLMSSGSCA
jgi:hypothetical protein